MALVPRVLEGAQAGRHPGMIVKLRSLGDDATADILGVILREEVGACRRRVRVGITERDRHRTARTLPARAARRYASGVLHKPFSTEARLEAGFDLEELESLLDAAD